MSDKTYIAIDLKSFYASVECMERGLDPMTNQSGGRRRQQDGENHLPCGISGFEILWEFPEDPDCLKSCKRSKRSTPYGSKKRRDGTAEEHKEVLRKY